MKFNLNKIILIKKFSLKCLIPLLTILLNLSSFLAAQTDPGENIVLTAPGPEYEAGWFHKLLFGSHWRDLWTTPVEVEILDLNKFAGGLTPFEQGGGSQTKSLKFKTKDGFRWKFRSINKDPKKILPEELQESLAGDVLQDQISSSNPMAPLIVVPLLKAVDVLQVEPKLVMMPDDEKLGEFRSEFAGLLGMIELHPDENDKLDRVFAGAEKISGTFKLLNRLDEKRHEKVSSADYLKARLMDIFLGDWDRHTDQWRWARYSAGDNELWFPIPRDRDQAFAKLNGLLPAIARELVPQLNHFDYNYPPIKKISWSGRFLDRRFLSELSSTQWDSVTSFIIQRLNNDVIEEAVNRLPAEHKLIAGEEIRNKLIFRRNNLSEVSKDFFNLINTVVDIYASTKDDYVLVNRLNDEETSVEIFRRNKNDGENEGIPFYQKLFDNKITDEIRIYLLNGDDKIILSGSVDSSPLVRVIGGSGKDEMIDSSYVKGYFLLITPIPDAENVTEFYDSGKKTVVVSSAGTTHYDYETPVPKNDSEKYEPQDKNRGTDLFFLPLPNYDGDNGLILAGGPLFYKYNFHAEPYEYRLRLIASYAPKPNSYGVDFGSRFYSLIRGARIDLKILKSELSLMKYYGYGNETGFSKDLEKSNYYLADREIFSIAPSIGLKVVDHTYISAGFSYDYSNSYLKNDTLLNNFPGNRYGLGRIRSLSLNVSIEYDSRDNAENPHSGHFVKLSGTFIPEVLDVNRSYSKFGFDIRHYLTTEFITESTLALRTGGEKVWGNYPFNEAAFLGGSKNIRGYSRDRFSGDAMLFAQAELRPFVTDIKIILKGRVGLSVFAETGRVFTNTIQSDKWHSSFGGGIWVSYLQRQLNLSFTAAKSSENLLFYFDTSMMF